VAALASRSCTHECRKGVDHLDGKDKIKLTKSDAPDGKHHLIPVGWVDHVDQHVHLNKAAKDVKAQWSEAA